MERIKKMNKTKSEVINYIEFPNCTLTSDYDIAHEFNNFFVESIHQIHQLIPFQQ